MQYVLSHVTFMPTHWAQAPVQGWEKTMGPACPKGDDSIRED